MPNFGEQIVYCIRGDTSGGLEEEMENIIGFENMNTELQNMFYQEGGDGEDTGEVDGSGTIGARHNNSTENILEKMKVTASIIWEMTHRSQSDEDEDDDESK